MAKGATLIPFRKDSTVHFLEYVSLLCLPLFLLLDLLHRAQPYATTRFWRLRAFLVSAAAFAFSMVVAGAIGSWLAGVSLFDLSGLGTFGGAVVGILVYEVLHYAYHRAAHTNGWLWRYGHQMHHSAEAVDAFGAYYLSPLDTLMFTSIASLVFFPLLGLSLEAGLVGSAFLSFNAVFQHANLRTPRWLGYLIQRPESHSLHHGRGVHAHNYADLPLVDMLFGTFSNPDAHRAEVGFWKGASSRLGAMWIGRDVSEPPTAPVDLRSRQQRAA